MSYNTRKWDARARAEEDARRNGSKTPPDRRTLAAIASALLEAQQHADQNEAQEKARLARIHRPIWK